jgi:hypothetical protein
MGGTDIVMFLLERTLGEITRYSSYILKHGEPYTAIQCYKLLHNVNDTIQQLYYGNVVKPSLQAVLQKERAVATYITAIIIWTMAWKDRKPFVSTIPPLLL